MSGPASEADNVVNSCCQCAPCARYTRRLCIILYKTLAEAQLRQSKPARTTRGMEPLLASSMTDHHDGEIYECLVND